MNLHIPASMPVNKKIVFLPAKEVCERCGFGRATLYRKINKGDFPQPVKMGAINAWVEHEVAAWQEALVEARDKGTEHLTAVQH